MNWFQKIATPYLDPQVHSIPGVPDWKDKIKEVHAKRDINRRQAEEKAEELGHNLSPWTLMNSSRCKKCGSVVYLHNIHGSTDAEDISGRAWTDKCDVNFDGGYQPCFGQELIGANDPGTRII